jgi:hypothetical protein
VNGGQSEDAKELLTLLRLTLILKEACHGLDAVVVAFEYDWDLHFPSICAPLSMLRLS